MLKFKKRVREINLKYFSLSGQVSSSKLNKPIKFESSLERDFIYLLEFDSRVNLYLEQPFEIDYQDENGINRKYIPDFIINYDDKFRKNEVIEIKYEYELLKNSKRLILKHEAARKYCIKNDLIFRICTDKDIRDTNVILLDNIKFLSRYRDFFNNINYETSDLHFDSSYAQILSKRARNMKGSTINELINSITEDEYKRAELIFITWYLVANGFIVCDLNKSLTLNSKVAGWYD